MQNQGKLIFRSSRRSLPLGDVTVKSWQYQFFIMKSALCRSNLHPGQGKETHLLFSEWSTFCWFDLSQCAQWSLTMLPSHIHIHRWLFWNFPPLWRPQRCVPIWLQNVNLPVELMEIEQRLPLLGWPLTLCCGLFGWGFEVGALIKISI